MSSQRRETHRKPEPETGEKTAIPLKTYALSSYSRRGPRIEAGMIRRVIRLPKGLKLSALVALAVPALIALTAITTLADSSPSPSGSPSALPGDPAKGATLFGQNCATCHGASMGGGIGPALNRIAGGGPLPPGELAKRTMLWVGIGIVSMIFVTYLLAQYNMRWIARRAAARRRQ